MTGGMGGMNLMVPPLAPPLMPNMSPMGLANPMMPPSPIAPLNSPMNNLVGAMGGMRLDQPAPSARYAGADGDRLSVGNDVRKTAFKKVRNNKVEEVRALLDDGVPVDIMDGSGNTLLAVACQNGHKRLSRVMLKRGADINSQNKRGQTPLHYCFAFDHLELADYLISKGADDSITNNYGLTCYEGLVREESSPSPLPQPPKHRGR